MTPILKLTLWNDDGDLISNETLSGGLPINVSRDLGALTEALLEAGRYDDAKVSAKVHVDLMKEYGE